MPVIQEDEIKALLENVSDHFNLNTFLAAIQFINEMDLATIIESVHEKDWSNLVKTVQTLYQMSSGAGDGKERLTKEQQTIIYRFLEKWMMATKSSEILQKAFQRVNDMHVDRDLSVFRNKFYILPVTHSKHLQQSSGEGNVTFEMVETNLFPDNRENGHKMDNRPFPLKTLLHTNDQKPESPAQITRAVNIKDSGAGYERMKGRHQENGRQEHLGITAAGNGGKIQQKPFAPPVLHLSDEGNKNVSYQRFVQQFVSILQRGKFFNNGHVQKLTVQLKPEHLGTLKIELVQKSNELVAKIVSQTNTAKELLESQLQALRRRFSNKISMSRIVLQASGSRRIIKHLPHHGQQQPDDRREENSRNVFDAKDSFQIH